MVTKPNESNELLNDYLSAVHLLKEIWHKLLLQKTWLIQAIKNADNVFIYLIFIQLLNLK
jgi:hypothetical protein